MPSKSKHNDITASQRSVTATGTQQDRPATDSVTALQAEVRMISGPIPSADELAKYEQTLPGSGERFLRIHERQIDLVEAQAHHRFGLESSVVKHGHIRSYLGMTCGALLVAFGFYISYQLGMHGHDVLAGTTFVADLGGIAGIFVYGTNSQRAERQDRTKALVAEERDHQRGN